MSKEFSLMIFLLICTRTEVHTVTVDNQLVSIKSDCFERIAIGAMLPFDKTFRNIDTNSLRICKENCIREGERCQTIAFGVHVRGNGTCQLSSRKIDATMTRPTGTIFDPDFDLYARKENCFEIPPQDDNENTIPTSGVLGTTLSGVGSSSQPPSSSSSLDPANPTKGVPTMLTTLSDVTDNRYSSRPTSSDSYPTVDYDNRPPPLSYDLTIDGTYSSYPISSSTNGDYFATGQPPSTMFSFSPDRPDVDDNYNSQNQDRIYYSHDPTYPLYKFPTPYDTNYPSDQSQGYPGVYAGNALSLDDRYRPNYQNGRPPPSTNRPPIYGSGYGSGYNYDTAYTYDVLNPRPTTSTQFDRIPTYAQNEQPTVDYGNGNRRPQNSDNSPQAQNTNGYLPRPQYGSSTSVKPLDGGYSQPPSSQSSPTQRPGEERPTSDSFGTSVRPNATYTPRPYTPGGGQGRPPLGPQEGNFSNGNEEPIETYFNPDDYFYNMWWKSK